MPQDIYNPAFVRGLFDEMAKRYGAVNLISSFGFAARWRKQCSRLVSISRGAAVVDLMTGMGEMCAVLDPVLGEAGVIRAMDISPAMCARARETANRCRSCVEVIEADVLANVIEPAIADVVICSFGLKTLSEGQITQLATVVTRILKPGGVFAFLEISVPQHVLLRSVYLVYLRYVIPLIGRLFLGNPDNYRMLGVYTQAFGDCGHAAEAFRRAGLAVSEASFFFGCATGMHGHKPHAGSRLECMNPTLRE